MRKSSSLGVIGVFVVVACGNETSPATDEETGGSSGIDLTTSTSLTTTLTTDDSGTSTTTTTTTGVDSSGSESGSSGGSESGGMECGNDVVEGDEVCDGTALAGGTCESEGFGPGTLACEADCTAFDTSGCTAAPGCGDMIIDATEDCEGADLANTTCIDEGFESGTLACDRRCLFDTSGCGTCGNMIADGDEACDTADLAMADCTDAGFAAGTLGCLGDCTFDTAMCTLCGNSMIDMGEACDDDDLGGQTCASVGMGFTGGPLGCGAACAFDTAACTSFAVPAEGELVITEVMKDPTTVADATGEWFEIHNPSGATTYQLLGCIIQGGGAMEQFTIDVDLEVGPGEYITFAPTSMAGPGFMPTFSWTPANVFTLSNTTDTVRLTCGNATVDEIVYDDAVLWPETVGVAMQLDPEFIDTVENDNGTWWCNATGNYNGDLGTPGSGNTQCATVGVPINLYFSEYVEGNSNNKALEIFNAEAFAVDLGVENCFIQLYSNGAMVPTQQLALAGSLAADTTTVVCNSQAGPALAAFCDQFTATAMSFTGNDTLVLACQNSFRDVIGQVGVDPGVAWGMVPDITTQATLRRDCTVTSGDPNGADAFDPATQWTGFPVDTFGDLGTYTCP